MIGACERVTWVGHATVLLEIGGARLLTDPILRDRLGHLRRQVPAPAPETGRGIDAVLLSHLHFDHLDVPSLRRLGTGVRIIAPVGSGPTLARLGFTDVFELPVGDSARIQQAVVTAVPAVHSGRRHPFGADAEAIGFTVAGANRVYFAGDTDLFDGMRYIAPALDVALLPVWGWGPTLGPGHMDPLVAARATVLLHPRVAVPIHWATFFPAGLARIRPAPLNTPGPEFARHAAELAPDVDVQVLAPGESLALGAPHPHG